MLNDEQVFLVGMLPILTLLTLLKLHDNDMLCGYSTKLIVLVF